MIVCVCHAVPDTALRRAAAAGLSADEIVRVTKAGTSCGVCATEVARIVGANDGCDGDGHGSCPGCPRAAVGRGTPQAAPERDAA
jgi:bacterioferritin-associated ferredoxin